MPRAAFFWSSNMRGEQRIRCEEFESFKGASGAQWFVSSMVRWMCRNGKDWVRASGEELDGIAVCASAEEGGGAAWTEGASRQKVWRDAREALHGGGGVS